MTDILEPGENFYIPAHFKLPASKQQQQQPQNPPREPTPPQSNNDEVDDVDNNENMDYRFEQARLDSYQGWPIHYVSPTDLAAAGFYYTKQSDRVKCFECNTEICRWEEGDNPMTEHQRWGGRCRFIRKMPCGNVPIGIDPSTVPLPRPRSRDVCGPYSLDCRLNLERASASSSPKKDSSEGKIPTAAQLGSFNLGIPKRPDFPEYASYEARLQSFEQWPTSLAQTKEQLAEAGFFYTKTGDQTTCYHCGGGLKNWEPQDDPWVQHAKWFSKCFYVLTVKGQDFVNQVTGKQTTPPTDEEAKNMNLPSYIKKVENLGLDKKPKGQTVEQNTVTVTQPGPSSDDETKNHPRSASPAGSTSSYEGSTASSNSSQEKKPIDDARACKICYSEEMGIVFLPCGHMVACVKCAPGMTDCALCREPVKMTVRVFFS